MHSSLLSTPKQNMSIPIELIMLRDLNTTTQDNLCFIKYEMNCLI